MIIKKPYVFLIKNFKKIHILLLVFSIYLYYITMNVNSFVKEFMELGTYNPYIEPISKYCSVLTYIVLIIALFLTAAIAFLLKGKGKPWKLYLVPVANYILLLVLFIASNNFFNSYSLSYSTSAIRAIRDGLIIAMLPQFFNFILFIIRSIGIDLKKFNFKMDKEYLELTENDKEEIEISVSIDKYSIKRTIKKLFRNLKYFYNEHKKVITLLAAVLLVIIGYNTYKLIFVTHKSYTVGDTIEGNGYTITINDAYFTDKNYNGQIIDKKNNFVIIDISIINNMPKRKVNFNNFHIMNGTYNYTPTAKKYEESFMDLGTTYDEKTLGKGERFNTLLIYKVSKELNPKKFVLYYQEVSSGSNYLRKIKLKLKDISEIKDNKTLELTEEMKISLKNINEELSFDNVEFVQEVKYKKRSCSGTNCTLTDNIYRISDDKKIMIIEFSSNSMDGKDMIDFLTKYGKIRYIDSKDESVSLEIKNAIGKTYYGKYAYIKVPNEMVGSKEIKLELIVRDNKYVYILK